MANYVDNNEFLELLIEYKNTGCPRVFTKLGRIFILIATNALNKTRYINYTPDIKDELISDATYNMSRYWYGFKTEEFKNPHSYFTSCAINAYKLYFKKYYKRRDMFISLSFIENFDKDGQYD